MDSKRSQSKRSCEFPGHGRTPILFAKSRLDTDLASGMAFDRGRSPSSVRELFMHGYFGRIVELVPVNRSKSSVRCTDEATYNRARRSHHFCGSGKITSRVCIKDSGSAKVGSKCVKNHLPDTFERGSPQET